MDNDGSTNTDCLQVHKGGWYHDCHKSNLNGIYYDSKSSHSDGIIWESWYQTLTLTQDNSNGS